MNRLRDQIIDAITEEIRRIFGQRGFFGEEEEYDWLLACYSVTEDDDIRWQCILADGDNTLDLDRFLARLLAKYRSNILTYPSPVPSYDAPAA